MTEELTPEIVSLAYKLFLGRVPESQSVIHDALGYRTLGALRTAFLSSAEFSGIVQGARSAETRTAAPKLVPIGAPPIEIEWQVQAEVFRTLLEHVKATWTLLGHDRPHWSVLSAAAFTPEEIGKNEVAFFSSGNNDATDLLAVLKRHGVSSPENMRLLEFGCGIGRVTPHLARIFAHVEGCDVSSSHMDMARVTVAGAKNVTFHLVVDDRFGMTAPFDVWFSRIVLQHNSPPVIAMILRRALTLLAPGGFAVFQVPTYATGYRFRVADYLAGLGRPGQIEMHVLPQPVILSIARACDCNPLEVLEDMSAGPSNHWSSTTFVLRKRDAQPQPLLDGERAEFCPASTVKASNS